MKHWLIVFVLTAAFLAHADVTLCKDNFVISLSGWAGRPYWAGKISQVNHGGKRALHLTATQGEQGKYSARITKHVSRTEFQDGTAISLVVRAKGNGTVTLGLLAYGGVAGNPVDYVNATEKITLTPEFQEYRRIIISPSDYASMRPTIFLEGENSEMFAESFSMTVFADPKLSIASDELQIVSSCDQLRPMHFISNRPQSDFSVSQWCDQQRFAGTAKSDAKGTITVHPQKDFKERLAVKVFADGQTASSFAIMESAKEIQQSRTIAAKIRLPQKMHVLIIGDSLSDFYRGYNYVNRVSSWLNAGNPGMFSFRNAGVGGDYLFRVQERMIGLFPGMPSGYRQEMYKALFKEKYDLIFIFLGANDTRSNRSENYAKPLVPPDQQKRILTYVIKRIRQNSNAKIVLISPSPSDPESNLERAEKIPAKQEFVLFGKPEFVDAYDRVVREVAKEMGVDYIDVLSVMRAESDRASLFMPDGVHLSLKGGRMIADEILKYFAGKYPAQR